MDDTRVRLLGSLAPLRRPGGTARASPNPAAGKSGQPSFEGVLHRTIAGELRFSAHARNRLEQRGIRLEQADLTRLQDAVSRAEGKGIRSSLVLSPKATLVVNVPTRTVITAVAPASLAGASFTEIDGAVFVEDAAPAARKQS